MKILKFLLVVAIALFSLQSFAQSFGIKAGLNLANQGLKDDDGAMNDDFKLKMGIHVGATLAIPISGNSFMIEPGLMLSIKGYNYETVDFIDSGSFLYIDIPINLKLTHDMGSAKIYAAIGPYIGILVKATWESDNGTETFDGTYEIGNDELEDDYKRLDMGVGIGGGLEFGSISVGVSYSFSLINISPYTDNGWKETNKVIGISIGYRFGE